MKKQKKNFDSLIEPINNYLESYHAEQRIANAEGALFKNIGLC